MHLALLSLLSHGWLIALNESAFEFDCLSCYSELTLLKFLIVIKSDHMNLQGLAYLLRI